MSLRAPQVSPKDIERDDDLEVGDEEGEQARDDHRADALQHALPAGDHRLLLC